MQVSTLDGLEGARITGERLVERAVGLVLFLCVALLAVGAVAAVSVRMNVGVKARGLLGAQAVWPVRVVEGGRVHAVLVQAGDTVAVGQPLVELDRTELGSRRKELMHRLGEARLDLERDLALRPIDLAAAWEQERLSELAVSRARADLSVALVDHGRSPDIDAALGESGGATHVVIDRAVAALRSELARLRIARLTRERIERDSLSLVGKDLNEAEIRRQLSELDRQLEELVVRASHAGVVLTDRPGTLLGRTVAPGERVLDIGATTGWRVELLVPEAEVHRVRAGQPVVIEVGATERDRLPPLAARVTSVAIAPWDADGSDDLQVLASGSAPMYRVTVALEEPGAVGLDRIREGFSVDATIAVSRERVASVILGRLFGRASQGR